MDRPVKGIRCKQKTRIPLRDHESHEYYSTFPALCWAAIPLGSVRVLWVTGFVDVAANALFKRFDPSRYGNQAVTPSKTRADLRNCCNRNSNIGNILS